MELRSKISKKREEGVQIANEKYFEECYNFFCQKAKVRIKLRLMFLERQFGGERHARDSRICL